MQAILWDILTSILINIAAWGEDKRSVSEGRYFFEDGSLRTG